MSLYAATEIDSSWHAMPEWVRRRSDAIHQGQRRSLNEFPGHSGLNDSWQTKGGESPEKQQQAAARSLQDESAIMHENDQQDESPQVNKKDVAADQMGESAAGLAQGKRKSSRARTSIKGLGLATHTVRFHGALWKSIVQTKRSELEHAFKKDVVDVTEIEEKRIEDLTFEYKGMLVARFTINHNLDEEEMMYVHTMLQTYDFPHMLALYPNDGVLKSHPKDAEVEV
ncbi:putative mitotubule-associated protein Gb4 [Trypanosoma theileri]|uniref:Putative mitotubule-associated protein Gb4 n=1 Tax=Trypanosoma theileri TaxID=67003 RepID=A0A1X0P8T2_9TRYP|nr:putative mitotubule-associated protein Gb4 [Trypanosoma theileri]ORC92860.1 putative mitotubule-associated protein Gb4 [Trypanosoma theileri]